MAPEDKSYASPASDMAKLLAAIEKLQSEVADIKKKVDGKKEPKKEYDSELALAAALAPLCGLSTWGFNPLLLPFGLRLAAARALVLHRALDRAATITKELAKAGDESAPTSDDGMHILKWFFSRSPEEKTAMFEALKSGWTSK
jgi:hypothetical protein